MIIVTGSGRSGTGMYAKMFSLYHEYNVSHLVSNIRALANYENPSTDLLANVELRYNLMKEHLQYLSLDKFGDSNNIYIHFLDVLYEMDRNIKIIIGARDGREFVTSGIARGYHLHSKYTVFMMQPEADDNWHASGPSMSAVEKMAWWWQYRYEKALDRVSDVPTENLRIVRLEDLTGISQLGVDVVTELESFAGRKAERRWLKERYNASKVQRGPGWASWSPRDREGFLRVAGETMRKLEYACD